LSHKFSGAHKWLDQVSNNFTHYPQQMKRKHNCDLPVRVDDSIRSTKRAKSSSLASSFRASSFFPPEFSDSAFQAPTEVPSSWSAPFSETSEACSVREIQKRRRDFEISDLSECVKRMRLKEPSETERATALFDDTVDFGDRPNLESSSSLSSNSSSTSESFSTVDSSSSNKEESLASSFSSSLSFSGSPLSSTCTDLILHPKENSDFQVHNLSSYLSPDILRALSSKPYSSEFCQALVQYMPPLTHRSPVPLLTYDTSSSGAFHSHDKWTSEDDVDKPEQDVLCSQLMQEMNMRDDDAIPVFVSKTRKYGGVIIEEIS